MAEVFTVRLPKPTDAGVTLIAGLLAATPVPVRPMVSGDGLALLVIEMLPETAPVDVGWNETVKFTLAPAATVAGATSPDMPNPLPVIFACDIDRVAVPVFERVTV